MNEKITLALLATVLLLSRCAPLQAASDPPPNIVFIFVDDQGYYDLGCYGATEVKTPRIDAMAKEGTRFTDYYAAAPICSPSRAGLLTGCYPRRVGNDIWVHRADSRSGIHPDELTIAELLKDKRLRDRLHRQMASRVSRAVPAAQSGLRSLFRTAAQS